MSTRECVAMILAGGRGERLGALTRYHSKPAVYFGGRYRIIDFTLNNCRNSGIDTVGILSQSFTADLNAYAGSLRGDGSGQSGIRVLSSSADRLYKGTADAVYRNLGFIEDISPELVLVLASDHVYSMDYKKMIDFHKASAAQVTVASTPVSAEEAPRFGIIGTNKAGRVLSFEEKPSRPKSNLASMGIYVFNRSVLKRYLVEDSCQEDSKHDFGRDILPQALADNRLYTYRFDGYWRDVGTVSKLWESNMDVITDPSVLSLADAPRDAFYHGVSGGSDFFAEGALVSRSILSGGCIINGSVRHSILGGCVSVGHGSEIINSVIMPNVHIGDNVRIVNAIVGDCASIADGAVIGAEHGPDFFVDRQVCTGDVSLISPWAHVGEGMVIKKNSHVSNEGMRTFLIEEAVMSKQKAYAAV